LKIRKSRYTTGINNTCGKFATGINYSTPVANLLLVSTKTAVNFPTGTTGLVDTDGQFAEVGGPQIANLWTYKICHICRPSANVAICRFADLRFANPIFLRFADPNFFADLKLCKSANVLIQMFIKLKIRQTNLQPIFR
jgi:hypothetical protein